MVTATITSQHAELNSALMDDLANIKNHKFLKEARGIMDSSKEKEVLSNTCSSTYITFLTASHDKSGSACYASKSHLPNRARKREFIGKTLPKLSIS